MNIYYLDGNAESTPKKHKYDDHHNRESDNRSRDNLEPVHLWVRADAKVSFLLT